MTKLLKTLLGVVVGCLTIHGAGARAATLILDQSVPDGNTSFNIDFAVAQSFTIGVEGKLAAIEFLLSSPSSSNPTGITFAVVPALPDGSPPLDWEATALVSASRMLPDQSRRWERIEFDPFTVSAGDRYFWIVREDFGGLSLRGFFYASFLPDLEDQYPSGEHWVMTASDTEWSPFRDRGADLSFRTFVVPVPAPVALPLFATGLAVLGLLGWRRHREVRRVAPPW